MKNIYDELFGELSYNYCWNGKTTLEIFGVKQEVSLLINCDEGEEISVNQRLAYTDFKEHSEEILKSAELAIFNYYLSVYQNYQARLQDAESMKKNVPTITAVDELKDLVKAQSLLIDYDYNNGKMVLGILFECTWEPEHGVAVRIENGEIVKAGFQDIVI